MDLIKSWTQSYSLASKHLMSYTHFLNFGLPKILNSQVIKSKNGNKQYTFTNVKANYHDINLSDSLIRDNTYLVKITTDIIVNDYTNSNDVVLKNIVIANIPMIVQPQDTGSDGIGGYYVINSHKRNLITQIRLAYNTPIVSFAKTDAKKNRVKSEELKKNSNLTDAQQDLQDMTQKVSAPPDNIFIELQIRSISEASKHSCATTIMLTTQDQLLLSNTKFQKPISIPLILKALGCVTLDHFVWATMCDHEIANFLFQRSFTVDTQKDALIMLSDVLAFTQKSIEKIKIWPQQVLKFLTFEIFPHLGLTVTPHVTAVYICSLVKKIFDAKRTNKADDRDSLIFKRFESSGTLVSGLLEPTIKKWLSTLQDTCFKKDDIILAINPDYISKKINYCFSTGTWGTIMSNFKRLGVSQIQNSGPLVSQLSLLNRLSNPISKETKNQPVRQLHPSSLNYLCIFESPEGPTIGIVLNFAICTQITLTSHSTVIVNALRHLIIPINIARQLQFLLFINGRLVGMVMDAIHFFNEFAFLRRIGRFDSGKQQGMVSIGIIDKHIFIWCDEGRVVRPIKTFGYSTCTNWREGLLMGELQWLDPFEQEFGFIRHTSVRDLHPSTMFGLSASLIPFCNFQPVPRNVYATNMNKQAISSLGHTDLLKCNNTHVLTTRLQHVPFVTTKMAEILDMEKYPTGNNVLVAICPCDGYNQEDAIVINRASLERGLFAADSFKIFKTNESFISDYLTQICIPDIGDRNKTLNYCMLDNDGVIKLGMVVEIGDVLVGQCTKHNKKIEDCSLSVMRGEEGVVHHVEKKRKNGFLFVKIIIASDLPVNIGDKFASRFSQKGVVGQIKNVWELPYMADGTVPDIIINPLSLPSRMTIPTILETLCGMITIQTGHHFVISAFDELSIKDLKQQVANVGFNANGTHQLRNAETGNLMTPIFMGPMYYNRLAHLSEEKCYARETGPMSKLTRQPTDGRSRMGGLRVGEMERDAILALNMGKVLMERLFTSSDKFWINICKNCNNMSINDKLCFCGATSESIKKVKCCFTNNLVFSQLKSLLCLVQFDKKPDQLQIVDEMEEDDEI